MVVVSEGRGPLVGVADSGDEAQMLSRALPGAAVVVGADRFTAGRWAETHFHTTVHVLDDGFQHVRLARDIDLVLLSAADLDERVLPTGRLREPLDTAAVADAVLVPGSDAERARVQSAVRHSTVFELVPSYGPLRRIHPFGDAATPAGSPRVVAVAGIARPERFLAGLVASGFDVATALTFRDHHWFAEPDVRRIEDAARSAGTSLVVTTEKDAVRLESHVSTQARQAGAVQWAYQPYEVCIEPDATFRAWLSERLAAARQRRATSSPQ
jgi:tetraacyldisaccharide 4'-kinase